MIDLVSTVLVGIIALVEVWAFAIFIHDRRRDQHRKRAELAKPVLKKSARKRAPAKRRIR